MKSSTLNDILNCINRYPICKQIYWIGAGVDHDGPTNLPLGNDLTKLILESACGKANTDKLLNAWEQSAKNIRYNTQNQVYISDKPRLETVLEGIRIFENHLEGDCACRSVLNGLESFKDAPPNSNHFVLAKLIHNGANIVTTNYSSCIAIAYNSLYKNELQLTECNGVYVYESDCPTAGKIYYIHGIAQHIENIGATLSIVKNPLTKEFTEQVYEWIKSDSCFIYLGYSGVDSLDVNPFFRSIERAKVSTGIYIRHSFDKNETNIINSNTAEEGLIACFNNHYLLYYKTDLFLKELSVPKDPKIKETKCFYYKWKDNFSKYCKPYSSRLQEICILSILYLLTLNPKDILNDDWDKNYLDYFGESVGDWFLSYYGSQNCVRCAKTTSARRFASKLPDHVQFESGIMPTNKRYIYLIKSKIGLKNRTDIEHINEKSQNSTQDLQIIEWDSSAPINRLTNYLIFIQSKSFPYFNILKKIFKKKINAAIQKLYNIINAGPLYVAEINQINVAYANLGVLELIVNKNTTQAKKYINMAKHNYIEVNSISGLINSLIYELLYNELLYFYENADQHKETAISLYNQIKDIIEYEKYMSDKKRLFSSVIKIGKKTGIEFKN